MKPLCSSIIVALALTASSAPADSPPNSSPTDLSATFSRAGLTTDQVSRLRNGIGMRQQSPAPGSHQAVVSSPSSDRSVERPAKAHNRSGDCRQPPTSLVVVYSNPVWYDPSVYLQEVQDYYQPGYEWGVGLRENSVRWDTFVPYLKQYLAEASSVGQEAFRNGFVAGFGGNAEAIFDRAARRAYR